MGGVEITAAHQAEELAARGHDVTVFTSTLPDGYDAGQCTPPPRVRVVRRRPLLRIKNMPLDPCLADIKGFDVVHAHLPYLFGAELVAISTLRHDTPFTFSFHGGQNDGNLKQLLRHPSLNSLGDLYIRYLSTRCVSHAAKICLIAENQAEHPSSPLRRLVARYPERVVCVPNGVNTRLFAPPARRMPADGLRLVWCGRLDSSSQKHKRPDIALDAMTALPSSVRLRILGDGDLHDHWQAEIERRGLSDRVQIVGRLSQREVAAEYRRADALISTSTSEGIPLAILEAMSTELPVIVPDLVGLDGLVEPDRTGLIFCAGAVSELVAAVNRFAGLRQSERAQIGSAARKLIERRYTWKASADALEAALVEAAAKHKPTRT